MVEAEGFDNLGGWVVDQQFMDQMGSPYVLAHGLGQPVTDATTSVALPATGRYRVWVRTRDWVATWAAPGAPGKFQLLINNKPLKNIFGTEGADWHWQDGGTVEIDKKQVTLALHDLTGFEGRCDAIVFTTNMDFIPPNQGKEMAAFRLKTLGLPKKPEDAGRFDLVVVGGGIAGTCTAVSAARLGLQVALIQDRPVLGGNNSSDVRVHLGGKINLLPYPALGNIVNELDSGHHGNAREAQFYDDQKKLRVVQEEENIHLFLNMHVNQVEKKGDRIVAVVAKHTRIGKELRFVAPLFTDCTGDGTIGFLAGAHWRMGRESQSQSGESLAPEKPDKMTLGTSVMWYSVENDEPISFPECPWALQFTEKTCQDATMGNWDWETGLHRDTIAEAEHIRDHMFRAIYGNWAFQKNNSRDKAKYANRKLAWIAYIGGKRESRRLLGDVILQQQDIQQNREFPDAFVPTTWSIDLHYPHPKNSKLFPGQEFRSVARHTHIQPYPIPYRCLYSRYIENLFMAGRDISVTHVALGTVRVMRTCGMMGEVVGLAASLCKKYNTTPRGVYQHHLAELKELAKRGVGKSKPIESVEMVFPGADWQQATAESQGLDSNRLEATVSYLRDNSGPDGVNELVIIRNGYMIWKGSNIDKVHGVWSLTKSFTSTVLGLLIDDGKATLETLVKDYVLSMTKTYPTVTLGHFATMTSGYYAVGDEPRGGYKHGPSRTPFLPCEEPLFPPGTKYAYWDSAMNQFANTLIRIAGEPIEELFKRRIAEPIGMNPSKWRWGDFGEVDGIVVNGGSGNQNKHIFISARELARFGHLFLNRGLWNGRQLISQSWVDTATKAHVPASLPLEQLSGADGRGVYGFNWWTNGVKPDGQRKWPDAQAGTYAASGYNNNDMFVIPEWNMVIVRLGLDERQKKITDAIYNAFLQKVGLAIKGTDSGNSASESAHHYLKGEQNTSYPPFKKALENGRLANEGFIRCRNLVKGWLKYADPKTGLIPRNLKRDRDIWNAKDSAADNYPFMVLTTAITDRPLFEGGMLDMLHMETKLTSRIGAMPDTYSFSKQGFRDAESDLGGIIFGSSEYIKDGLLPLTEWLGKSPWSERMLTILDDIWKHAPIETKYGKIVSTSQEVNGEMLQVLSRVYWMTGRRRYLRWAIRLGDYYLLDGHHPTKDAEKLSLDDHGCEIVSGLCELYATLHFAEPQKKRAYEKPIHEMLDRILEVGRDEHGLFYNWIEPQTGRHTDSLTDNWGYNLNGFYTVYLIDKTESYHQAVRKALSNLNEHYRDYQWERGGADGYADSIEGAINLYNREPVGSVAQWLDSEIKVMWNKQQPDGVIEGWHGDGNFARTTIMYCLWKTKGLTIGPWRKDVIFGAMQDGDVLKITLRAEKPWQGKLIFDTPRHKTIMKMPLDWPRINQFPEWFTVETKRLYTVCDLKFNSKQIYTGRQLREGLTIDLEPGTEYYLVVE